MSEVRRSIAKPATVKGVGVHTGTAATATFKPSDSGSGVRFRRSDLDGSPEICATLDAVHETDRRTTLTEGEASVSTVEHVLAAVTALEIDDLLIELDGPEAPAGDGSAAPYFEALRRAGTRDQEGSPMRRAVRTPFTVKEGDAQYVVAPAEALRLTVTIEWDHPLIGAQSGSYRITPDVFDAELSRARTFGFESEADELHQHGLAGGASAANTIVLSKDGVVGTTLRWPDEFVRHKTVDLLGDLGLLGGRLAADIVAFRPSHRGNVALARAIGRAASLDGAPVMGIQDILNVLPHRYPFLLVDRIIALERGKRIVGLKNVTMNEPFFPGHFPGHPVMPGVLIVEAMAQTGGMLLLDKVDDPGSKVVYFMSIDGVKFRKPVVPGDQLRFEVEMVRFRGRTCAMKGVAYVDGQPVAEAEMMAAIVDR